MSDDAMIVMILCIIIVVSCFVIIMINNYNDCNVLIDSIDNVLIDSIGIDKVNDVSATMITSDSDTTSTVIIVMCIVTTTNVSAVSIVISSSKSTCYCTIAIRQCDVLHCNDLASAKAVKRTATCKLGT
jgi:hypothetical protein